MQRAAVPLGGCPRRRGACVHAATCVNMLHVCTRIHTGTHSLLACVAAPASSRRCPAEHTRELVVTLACSKSSEEGSDGPCGALGSPASQRRAVQTAPCPPWRCGWCHAAVALPGPVLWPWSLAWVCPLRGVMRRHCLGVPGRGRGFGVSPPVGACVCVCGGVACAVLSSVTHTRAHTCSCAQWEHVTHIMCVQEECTYVLCAHLSPVHTHTHMPVPPQHAVVQRGALTGPSAVGVQPSTSPIVQQQHTGTRMNTHAHTHTPPAPRGGTRIPGGAAGGQAEVSPSPPGSPAVHPHPIRQMSPEQPPAPGGSPRPRAAPVPLPPGAGPARSGPPAPPGRAPRSCPCLPPHVRVPPPTPTACR